MCNAVGLPVKMKNDSDALAAALLEFHSRKQTDIK